MFRKTKSFFDRVLEKKSLLGRALNSLDSANPDRPEPPLNCASSLGLSRTAQEIPVYPADVRSACARMFRYASTSLHFCQSESPSVLHARNKSLRQRGSACRLLRIVQPSPLRHRALP